MSPSPTLTLEKTLPLGQHPAQCVLYHFQHLPAWLTSTGTNARGRTCSRNKWTTRSPLRQRSQAKQQAWIAEQQQKRATREQQARQHETMFTSLTAVMEHVVSCPQEARTLPILMTLPQSLLHQSCSFHPQNPEGLLSPQDMGGGGTSRVVGPSRPLGSRR